MNKKFELLLVKDKGNYWEVIGITYSNAMLVEPDCSVLRATLFTIEECKTALAEGKKITINKIIEFSEVQVNDLVIETIDELSRFKQMAINEISATIQQALLSISIIELMDYLNNYVNLLNAGYFITDTNREEKYFEIIEASQSIDKPDELDDNSTFEQEQEYLEQKSKYDTAQTNLKILENYLNSYDKLAKIRQKTDFLNDIKSKINNSKDVNEIDYHMNIYRSNLKNYNMVNI